MEERMKLSIGDKVSDFTLPDTEGNDVTLSAEVREKRVVLVFYRGFW